ncbi:MAG: YbgA family protein [Syntrophales bacterium]
MSDTIRLGVSACLLGQNVRHDGGHKLDPFLRDTLGQYVEFLPVCPEVECGLPVPREAMHLAGDPAQPRLVTVKTGRDITGQMEAWGARRLEELESERLCGYIFKSRSPSSGMERVTVYTESGTPGGKTGVGIWARMFMARFPLLPVEDEGRLHDPKLRENFIERVFVFKRWRALAAAQRSRSGLVDFHTRHKLLIMAHSVEAYRELGRLVAGQGQLPQQELYDRYLTILADALRLIATPRKNTNVLHHIMGYFKKVLAADEKQELLELIDAYRREAVPLIVPVTLLNHYVRKYGQPYLAGQVYLNPHPLELKLRTHV